MSYFKKKANNYLFIHFVFDFKRPNFDFFKKIATPQNNFMEELIQENQTLSKLLEKREAETVRIFLYISHFLYVMFGHILCVFSYFPIFRIFKTFSH